jgi:hypothetical protein
MGIYKNQQELPVNDFEGQVLIKDVNSINTDNFKLEKDLVDYIIINIDLFTKDLFNDDVVSYEVDMPINKRMKLSPGGRRIDLYIVGTKKTYIIEAKNPSSGTENRAAIGQLLDYGREFPDSKKELAIITTRFDINTAKTIKYYNLPIRYIYISKKRLLEYVGEKNE